MASSNTLFNKIFTRSQVFFFACSVLTYSLGTAVAHYLGEGIDWGMCSSGLILVLFIQAAMGLTHTYFKMAAPSADNQPPTTNEELESRKKLSYILLGSVAALLTASALIVFSHISEWLSSSSTRGCFDYFFLTCSDGSSPPGSFDRTRIWRIGNCHSAL